MRTIPIILLTASALVVSASSSSSNSTSSVSAVASQHESSAKRFPGFTPTDEDRMLNPIINNVAPSGPLKLLKPTVTKLKSVGTKLESAATKLQSTGAKMKSTATRLADNEIFRSIGLGPSTADKALDQIDVDVQDPKSFHTDCFIKWYKYVKLVTPKDQNPEKKMLASLLRHADSVKLARVLEAATQLDENAHEVDALLEALLRKWAIESKTIDDVCVKTFKFDAGLETVFASSDLALANRFIAVYSKVKPKERTTLLEKLINSYGDVAVARQIALLEDTNPMITQWQDMQFPIWLAEKKQPSAIKELLKVDDSESVFTTASKIYHRYHQIHAKAKSKLA